jgi:hypothetical protein
MRSASALAVLLSELVAGPHLDTDQPIGEHQASA